MPTEITAIIGSGNQPFRRENHGKRHLPAQAVNVVNWEDQEAVYAVDAGVVSIDSTAGGTILSLALDGRRAIAVYNNGTASVYLGPSGVTEANGYPLPTGTEKAFAIGANLHIFAIAEAGNTEDIRLFEIA